MLLQLSKIIRRMHNIKTPKCNSEYYLPYSNNIICDCKEVCKFDPKNLPKMPIINSNLLQKNQYI